MRFKQVASIAAMALLLSTGVVSADDDGTGGPEMATPNPEGCNRELATDEVFEQFEQLEGGVFTGSIESVQLAEIQAREVISLKRLMEEIMSKHTSQTIEKVSADMERDYYMTSAEAREYGIIDRVIEHRS